MDDKIVVDEINITPLKKQRRHRLLFVGCILFFFIALLTTAIIFLSPPRFNKIYEANNIYKVLEDEGSLKVSVSAKDEGLITSDYYELNDKHINMIKHNSPDKTTYILYSDNLFVTVNDKNYYCYVPENTDKYSFFILGYNVYIKQATINKTFKKSGSRNKVNIDCEYDERCIYNLKTENLNVTGEATYRAKLTLGSDLRYRKIKNYLIVDGKEKKQFSTETKFLYGAKENFPDFINGYFNAKDTVIVTVVSYSSTETIKETFTIPKSSLFYLGNKVSPIYRDAECTEVYSEFCYSTEPVAEDTTIYIKTDNSQP